MITENLPIEYHQQDTDYYCGAACAQMVLNQIGSGHISQDGLYNENHAHSTAEGGWYTAPDGLNWTMNNNLPAGFPSFFVLDALDHEDNISRIIVWTIHHYKVGPIAMVYGWNHWIVIRGYEATAAPTSSVDTAYAISGFYVNNPWPPTVKRMPPSPPPPHTSGDICGSGGDYGIANEHIAYSTWQADYMTGIPSGHWSGKFVAVCDPDRPPEKIGRRLEFKRQFNGERIIDKHAVPSLTWEAFSNYGHADKEYIKNALSGTKPGDAVLVQRLDRANDFYYITPFLNEQGQIRSMASIDGRFGNYKQSFFSPEPNHPLFQKKLNKETILEILGNRLELTHKKRVLTIHPEALCIYPTLVWMPCEQSLSPYWPFHMVTIGNERIYIRIDGRVFTKLNTNYRGI